LRAGDVVLACDFACDFALVVAFGGVETGGFELLEEPFDELFAAPLTGVFDGSIRLGIGFLLATTKYY
jgi:hypothetical protein